MAETATIVQDDPKPKLWKVWKYLGKSNVAVHEDFEDFRKAMEDPDKLDRVHLYLKKNRVDVQDDPKDFRLAMFPEPKEKIEKPVTIVEKKKFPSVKAIGEDSQISSNGFVNFLRQDAKRQLADKKEEFTQRYKSQERIFDESPQDPNLTAGENAINSYTNYLNKTGRQGRTDYLQSKANKRTAAEETLNAYKKAGEERVKAPVSKEEEFLFEQEAIGYQADIQQRKIKRLLPSIKMKSDKIDELMEENDLLSTDALFLASTLDELRETIKTDDPEAVAEFNDLIKDYQEITDQFNNNKEEATKLISDPEYQEYQTLQKSYNKTVEASKGLIKRYPEEFAKAIDAKEKQLAVEMAYMVNPEFKRYASIVSPIGRAITGALKGLVSLPRTFTPDNEYGVTDQLAYVAGVITDAIDETIFPQPESFKQALFDVGGEDVFKEEILLPKFAKTAADMFILLTGYGGLFTLPKAAGIPVKTVQSIRIMAGSVALTNEQYYSDAVSRGLNPDDASYFAMSSAIVTSMLEMISPQRYLMGGAVFKKGLSKSYAQYLSEGMSRAKAFAKSLQFVLKETGLENIQELSQFVSDKAIEYGTNELLGDESFDAFSKDLTNEVLETVALTSLVTFFPSAGRSLNVRSEILKNSIELVAEDPDQYLPKLYKAFDKANTPLDYRQFILNQIEKKSGKPLPKPIEKSMEEIAQAVQTGDTDGMKQGAEDIQRKVESQIKPKEDDSTIKQRLPGEEPLGEKPVEEKPVKKTGEKETTTSGVFQAPTSEKKLLGRKALIVRGNNRYEVSNKGGILTVTNKKTNKGVSKPTERSILNEYTENLDYTIGNKAQEPGKEVTDPDAYIAQNSDNPAEIASQFVESEATDIVNLDHKTSVIADHIGKVPRESFIRFGDRNLINNSMARSYFNKEGTSIDVLAKELSEISGLDVTEQDIVDFIVDHPSGAYQFKAQETSSQSDLRNKFRELTGLELTDKTAVIAIDQAHNKDGIDLNKYLDQEYETQKQAEDAYYKQRTKETKPDAETTIVPESGEKSEERAKAIAERKEKGKTLISEGFDELALALGAKFQITGNPLDKTDVFNAVKKIADGLVTQGIATVEELIERLNKAIANHSKLAGIITSSHIQEYKDRLFAPPGEKPKRRIHGAQKTLQKAKDLSAKAQVAKVVEDMQSDYEQLNIAGTADQAKIEVIEAGGFDNIMAQLLGTDRSDLPLLQTKRVLALFHYGGLLDKAIADRNNELAERYYTNINEIQNKLALESTYAGQASIALRLWRALRPDGTVEFVRRKMVDHNKAILNKKDKKKRSTRQKLRESEGKIQGIQQKGGKQVSSSEAIDEAIAKVVNRRKGKTIKTSPEKIERSKQKIEQAKADRKQLTEEFKSRQKDLFYSTFIPGLTPEGVEYIGRIAKTYLDEGFARAEIISEKVREFLQSEFDYVPNEGDVAIINRLARALEEVQIEDFVKDITKDIKSKVKEIVSEHWAVRDAEVRSLTDKLVDEAGVSKKEAEYLAEIATQEFKKTVKEEAQKELTRLIGKSNIPKLKKKKDVIDKVMGAINLGALQDEFYTKLFAEHFGLVPDMSISEAQELERLANIVQQQPAGSIFERIAMMEMIGYLDKLYPKSDIGNTFISLAYASMLSGLSTSTLNLFSAGSNMVTKPLRDAVNLSKWIRAVRKGIKDKSLKTFWDYNPLAEVLYVPIAYGRGIDKGMALFKEVWKNGDFDNKYLEQIRNNRAFSINPLETKKYDANRFRPIYLVLGKFKLDLNIFNYYKFSARNLSAQDKLMFATSYDLELVGIIREKLLQSGLRRKDLRKAVLDEYMSRNVNMGEIMAQLEEEIANYEKETGKKITASERKIRLSEIQVDNMDLTEEEKKEAEQLARSNIFTDDRGGVIANMARAVGALANRNLALAFLIKPFVPFTKVVGNVAEFMLDFIPIYGQMRGHGLSVTSLILRAEHTSQMGEIGSRAYYEQMGRAWFGTVVMLSAFALFLGTDEDDFLEITGGFDPEGKVKSGLLENVMPKYSIRIGTFKFSYLNIPALAVPFGFIGNLNDRIRFGDREEDMTTRATMALASTASMMKEMSFVKGVQDLFQMLTDLVGLSDIGKTEKAAKAKVERLAKELTRKYFGFATRPLPQNTAAIRQIQKFMDPKSYSQKEINEIMSYSIGIQSFTNHPTIDVLGDEIIRYPAENLIPYTHWFKIKGTDERWKFMFKHDAIPTPIRNSSNFKVREDDGTFTKRRLEADELYKYSKLSGELFTAKLREYMDGTNIKEREESLYEVDGKMITGIQKDLRRKWNNAKEKARREVLQKR